MDIFKIEGNAVVPTIHAIMIPPFSTIWEQDKDPGKANAISTFKYIEFSCSYSKSNPFKGYSEDVRKTRILQSIYGELESYDEFTETPLVKEAVELYNKMNLEASPTLQYYLSAKAGAEKMMNWLDTFDMETTNERTGMPLYKPRDITSALKDTYDVMKTLNALEEKVYEQTFEAVKTKANKIINHFER